MFFASKKILKCILIICLGVFVANSANAVTTSISSAAEKQAYQNKLDELKTFVNSGIEYIHKYGKAKAYKEKVTCICLFIIFKV
jgi:hypothetical protein